MRETGLFLPTGGKKEYFGCSYCKRDITQQLRIQCAVCDHYDLCGDCFAAGAQRFPHENTHDYRVVDCIDIPLFSKDWTASEELLMLEGNRCSEFIEEEFQHHFTTINSISSLPVKPFLH